MKRSLFGIFVMTVAVLATTSISYAQAAPTPSAAELEKNMNLMRKDLRSSKKQVIALNVPLTDTEATKFWPVYDQYAGEMTKQYDQFYNVIKEYAVTQSTMTDAQALAIIKRWVDIQAEIVKVRQKYILQVEKVLPGKKAALFFQIDRRLYMLMDLQVASEVPLVAQ